MSSKNKVIIAVTLESIFLEVKTLFRQELPLQWFEVNEIDEILIRIFNITISSIFNSMHNKNSELYKNCYQGNIDYLEYCGLSQSLASRIVHITELNIIKAIFETFPTLDDLKYVTVLDYHFVDKKDLFIIINFKLNDTTYETFNHNPNYSFTGLV